MRKLALVRRPGPRVAEGLVTHLERSPVDPDLALRQWQGYVDALHAEGWRTIEVPPGCWDKRDGRRGCFFMADLNADCQRLLASDTLGLASGILDLAAASDIATARGRSRGKW